MIEDDREDDNNESSNVNHLESLSGSSSVNTLLGTSAVVPSSKTSSIQKQQFQHGKKKPQTVFVGNISFRITQKELKDFFSKFGRVSKVCLVNDHVRKISKGFAFITFAKEETAAKAKMASPDELTLDNRTMRVLPANEKRLKLIKKNEEAQAMATHQIDDYNVEVDATKDDSCISVLNDDSLFLILSYLGIEDLVEAGHVCKRWQRLTSKCWASKKSLDFTNCFSRFGSRVLTVNTFENIIRQCSNLRKLDISSVVSFLGYRAIDVVANFCPHIESIDLSGGDLTDYGIRKMTEKCMNLKRVILKRCIHFGEKGLWWLLNLNQSLTTLDITGNLRINGKCFHHVSPELRILILDGCSKFAKYGFERIGQHCKLLTELSASGCASLTDECLLDVCIGCPNLRKLSLNGFFPNLTSTGIAHIQHLKLLVELQLFNNHAVDNQSLGLIAVGCHELQALDISACGPSVNDEGLRSLVACLALQKLHASYLELLTDDALCALANVGELKEARFRGCMSVSVDGCQALLNLCPQLETLDLSGCEMVGNRIIKTAIETVQSRENGPQLTVILGGTGVDRATMMSIHHPLLKIDTLNLCNGRYLESHDYLYSDESDNESDFEREKTMDEEVEDFLNAGDLQEEFEFICRS